MKNSFSKVTILTSLYLLSAYIIGIYTLYLANDFDLGINMQPAFIAFIKYLFSLVLPLSAFILLYKYRENDLFFKNLKFILYPLIKFEIIIYILSSALVILAFISIFLKINPIFIESFQVWMDATQAGHIASFKDAVPYLELNHPNLLTNLTDYISSFWFTCTAIVSMIFIVMSIVFFINTIQILLNQNLGFIKNIKKSFQIIKTKFIAIAFVVIIFVYLFSLFKPVSMESNFIFLALLLYKNFIFTLFANSLILLSEDDLNKSSSNDDVYDVEVND